MKKEDRIYWNIRTAEIDRDCFIENIPDGSGLYTHAVLPHAEFGRNDHRDDAPHFTRTF